MTRDFSTISPSARWLLMVKAHTTLPFAREAAELMFGAEAVAAAESGPDVAKRRTHFELRARSLDAALDDIAAERVLELAAGFSFRGLARAARGPVHYLDTNLPGGHRAQGRSGRAALAHRARWDAARASARRARPRRVRGRGRDTAARAARDRPRGLAHVSRPRRKARLAANIHGCLRARGGVSITADVYIRGVRYPNREAHVQQFLADHSVEEQKFADWPAADAFFTSHGFRIDRKLAPSSDSWRSRETWMMTVA